MRKRKPGRPKGSKNKRKERIAPKKAEIIGQIIGHLMIAVTMLRQMIL